MGNTNKVQCSSFWRSSGPLGKQITLNSLNVKILSSVKCSSLIFLASWAVLFWCTTKAYAQLLLQRHKTHIFEQLLKRMTCTSSHSCTLKRACVPHLFTGTHTLRSEEKRVAPDSCWWRGGKPTHRRSARLGSARLGPARLYSIRFTGLLYPITQKFRQTSCILFVFLHCR